MENITSTVLEYTETVNEWRYIERAKQAGRQSGSSGSGCCSIDIRAPGAENVTLRGLHSGKWGVSFDSFNYDIKC